MVLLHRTLGGLYSFAREFQVRADWKEVMWPYLHHAIDVSEGRIASHRPLRVHDPMGTGLRRFSRAALRLVGSACCPFLLDSF